MFIVCLVYLLFLKLFYQVIRPWPQEVHKFIQFNAHSYKNMNSALQNVTHNVKTNKNGL